MIFQFFDIVYCADILHLTRHLSPYLRFPYTLGRFQKECIHLPRQREGGCSNDTKIAICLHTASLCNHLYPVNKIESNYKKVRCQYNEKSNNNIMRISFLITVTAKHYFACCSFVSESVS